MNDDTATTLKLPADMVASIVRDRLNAEVLKAFGGESQLISELIDGLLRQPVNGNGVPVKKDSYEHQGNLLNYLAHDVLKKELSDALKGWFKDNAAEIRDEMVKQLSTKKVQKEIAAAMLLNLTKAANSNYGYFFKFSVCVNEKE